MAPFRHINAHNRNVSFVYQKANRQAGFGTEGYGNFNKEVNKKYAEGIV